MNSVKNKNNQFLKSIAWISAGFVALVCILVIANYFQVSRIDPVNTEVINKLVDRLNTTPDDEQLREQIRELDLLARKAYFTNRWQVKAGGYMILLGLGVFVLAYQLLELKVRKQVISNPDQPKDILGIQKSAQVGIALSGSGLVLVALIITWLTYNRLGEKINHSAISENNAAVSDTTAMLVVNDNPEPVTQPEQGLITSSDSVKQTTNQTEVTNPEKSIKENQIIETPKKNITKAAFPTDEELRRNVPSFRGFHSNGIVYQDNVPQTWNGTTNQNILWKVPVPVEGFNSPIVWGNKIFLSGANQTDQEIFCFDRKTGKLLWRTKIQNIPGSPQTPPKTTSDTGLAAPTMVTDGQKVYAIFATGDIVALDFEGKIVWSKNLGIPQNHYGHASSLQMVKDKLLVQYDQKDNPRLIALAAATGNEVWSTPRKVKISWASPVLADYKGKIQIILSADPLVASYDPETGKENWSLNCIYGEVGPSVCYADGVVYAMNEYASLVAIGLDNPSKVIWESDELLSDVPSPVCANSLLIIPTSYGTVGCFDAKTGEMLWDHEMENNIYSSPMLVKDNVYLIDMKGIMHIFKLSREYTQVAENPLGEDVVTIPAFVDGKIYIRGRNNLYCIGK